MNTSDIFNALAAQCSSAEELNELNENIINYLASQDI